MIQTAEFSQEETEKTKSPVRILCLRWLGYLL
jgi:hypothetical protein